MTPTLNWKELNAWVDLVRPEIQGLFLERIFIPARPKFPNGYIKGEWALRLTSRKQEITLFFSIRPRHPYLTLLYGKGPKAAQTATHSPFDLSLSKYLRGARLLDIESLPGERIVILWFSTQSDSEITTELRLGLVLLMIPAVPEAFLVSSALLPNKQANKKADKLDPSSESQSPDGPLWPIFTRSRTLKNHSSQSETSYFNIPAGSQAPQNLSIRPEFLKTPGSLHALVEKELLHEAFDLRLSQAEKSLRTLLKQAQDRLRQSTQAHQEAKEEKDWKSWADLLKSTLNNPPELIGNGRKVYSYITQQYVDIPCDPKLTIQEQVEKYYSNSKRRQRRISESLLRSERFTEVIHQLKGHLDHLPTQGNWTALEQLEKLAQIPRPLNHIAVPTKKSKKSAHSWLGKSFLSSDGLPIWVGRDKNENLELTFKCAKGNDLWMHVRGRPGAHVLIPLQPGKSVPLQTLLDAAHLALHYSGGSNWGKTEVDYTFKKYVKRIKDSTEASYTHNKTLLIDPDRSRIKKLLDQMNSNS